MKAIHIHKLNNECKISKVKELNNKLTFLVISCVTQTFPWRLCRSYLAAVIFAYHFTQRIKRSMIHYNPEVSLSSTFDHDTCNGDTNLRNHNNEILILDYGKHCVRSALMKDNQQSSKNARRTTQPESERALSWQRDWVSDEIVTVLRRCFIKLRLKRRAWRGIEVMACENLWQLYDEDCHRILARSSNITCNVPQKVSHRRSMTNCSGRNLKSLIDEAVCPGTKDIRGEAKTDISSGEEVHRCVQDFKSKFEKDCGEGSGAKLQIDDSERTKEMEESTRQVLRSALHDLCRVSVQKLSTQFPLQDRMDMLSELLDATLGFLEDGSVRGELDETDEENVHLDNRCHNEISNVFYDARIRCALRDFCKDLRIEESRLFEIETERILKIRRERERTRQAHERIKSEEDQMKQANMKVRREKESDRKVHGEADASAAAHKVNNASKMFKYLSVGTAAIVGGLAVGKI